MAYSALENILKVIPETNLVLLTNDIAGAKTINLDNLSSAIGYADKFIDGYLRNKYILPLKYVPEIITQISTDITAWRLWSRRPSKVPEHIKDNYEEAKKLLVQIQKEQILLDLPAEHSGEKITNATKMVISNKTKESIKFNDVFFKGFQL